MAFKTKPLEEVFPEKPKKTPEQKKQMWINILFIIAIIIFYGNSYDGTYESQIALGIAFLCFISAIVLEIKLLIKKKKR